MKKVGLIIITSFLTALSVNAKTNGDLALMNRARSLFAKGQLDQAIAIYEDIPKSSDYWLESLEERAQAHGRKKEYAKALAVLQTAMAPTFEGVVGPETYFAAALTNLKICNYSKIFDVTKKFKEVFQPRRESLQQIAEKGTNSALKELQSKLREKPLNFETAGSLMKRLPRYLIQDRVANGDKSKLATRARVLAKTELKEIDDVTNKLHIVEAELIHRVHLADKDAERNGKAGSIDDGIDVLKFPLSREVWIDELDSYQAEVEKCPTAQGRAG